MYYFQHNYTIHREQEAWSSRLLAFSLANFVHFRKPGPKCPGTANGS